MIHSFFKRSKTANSVVGDGIIQAFMVVLVTCKNDEDLLKNESTRVLTTFLPLQVNGGFSDVQG